MRFQEIKYDPDALPIKFAACGTDIPVLDEKIALYIVDFHELFDNQINEDELISILHSLNKWIIHKAIDLTFLQLPEAQVEICIQKVNKYLGEENNISSLLDQQEDISYTLSMFRTDCKEAKINIIVMGGIFGGGCVWAEAGKLAETIYTMLLPNQVHPNIRFLNEKYGFLFKKAIILAEICEGHTKEEKEKFHQYLCFPTSKYYKVKVGKDYINNLTYRTNVQEIQLQDKSACGGYCAFASTSEYKQLFQNINLMITPKSKPKRKRKFETPLSLLFQPQGDIQQSHTTPYQTESSVHESTFIRS